MINISTLAMPDTSNHMGIMHGGEIVKMMDNAAGVAAVEYCGGDVVTAHLETDFLSKIKVGSYVSAEAEVVFVGHMSVFVYVAVYSYAIGSERKKSAEGYFVMVPINNEGKPKAVKKMEPKFSPEAKKAEEIYKRIM